MKDRIWRAQTRRMAALASTMVTLLAGLLAVPVSPATAASQWEYTFFDDFNTGTWPANWGVPAGQEHLHAPAATNGQGQLNVGYNASVWTNSHLFQYPAGTRVRVSASLNMPDQSVSYASFWTQQPTATAPNGEPRELDVIESWGAQKAAGAQLNPAQFASHPNYDVGRPASYEERVDHHFAAGAKPWDWYWQYHAEWVVGGDSVTFSATNAYGNAVYSRTIYGAARVPNASGFRLRLSNKPTQNQVVGSGTRSNMLVDWVTVQVQRP